MSQISSLLIPSLFLCLFLSISSSPSYNYNSFFVRILHKFDVSNYNLHFYEAGSDSLLTGHAFFKMREVFFDSIIDNEKFNGILYGLGTSY